MRHRLDTLLRSPGLWFAARALLAVVFLSSGLAKLIDFDGGMAEMRAAGLAPAGLVNAAVALILAGGAVLLLLDRLVWLAALALGGFLLLTIPVVHAFWRLPDPQAAQLALFFALEHLSVVGGLLACAIASRLRRGH
ncbi:Nucleoside-diphosphate-sugar epimerases [plant metagenome]|uniref:Nucleoside-diphosphate-sugar epimerases n=1 Tax=plant metagenome TaxID=1297885 RepID=A0A484PC53_9ZZZZ